MESMVKIVGRDSTCDYIVCDQGRKISRKHVLIRKTNEKYVIEELGSVNGTFVNGNKIMPGVPVPVDLKSEILLAGVYKLDLSEIFKVEDVKGGETQLLSYDSKMVNFQSGERQIQVDSNLSNLGIQHETDQTKFISIGRAKDNNVIIENGNISRYQCKIRLINPFSFEIVDLGSSNGTFVNNEKLKPNESKVFYSTDSVRFGKIYTAELDKILPGLKKISPQISHPASNIKGISNTLHMSEAEKEAFMNLESLWIEFNQRISVKKSTQMKETFLLIMVVFVIFSVLSYIAFDDWTVSSIFSVLISLGAKLLIDMKYNKINLDHFYEDEFLQAYACPRCHESFQKKPWVTIRDCFKCKLKFR